jgi:hypothetical protein
MKKNDDHMSSKVPVLRPICIPQTRQLSIYRKKPFAVFTIQRQAVINNGGTNLSASIRSNKVAEVGTHCSSLERPHEISGGSEPIAVRKTILFRNKWAISLGRARIALSGRASEDPRVSRRPMFGSARKVSKTGRRFREQAITPTNSTCTRVCLKNACGKCILRVRWGHDPNLA